MTKPERDFEVNVNWEQASLGDWRLFTRRRFFATRAQANGAYVEELNNNGYLDPGREDIRNVCVELRYQGRRIGQTEGPCSPERNQHWLGEVRKVAASCSGPLVNALRLPS